MADMARTVMSSVHKSDCFVPRGSPEPPHEILLCGSGGGYFARNLCSLHGLYPLYEQQEDVFKNNKHPLLPTCRSERCNTFYSVRLYALVVVSLRR